ncbi:MAG TPA: hypothetical protein VGO11_04880 [Chthoniobacteraceae bacterium]|jgi:glucose/arabinose dehydrogenase|nr:hypothetical protein [Chthoniobacteraceae bacterium]
MELVANGFNFPTSVTFDTEGTAYVAEAGLGFAGAPRGGRILRVEPNGQSTCLLEGLRPPVNGLTFHKGSLLISEGGDPGRISRLSLDGRWETVLDGLPGLGNYHTNMVAVGPDERLYFSQGAMTNSGIVGLDAYELGWLRRLPHDHDLPGWDVVLAGVNVECDNPLPDAAPGRATTGAFAPFNTAMEAGRRVPARLPCTAAVLSCAPDGTGLELVAWGLRNAYGLGFLPDGRLLAVDQGADDRGSRPIGGAPDLLFDVQPGKWYGWPDFVGGVPVTDARFHPVRGGAPELLLANHAELPPLAHPLLHFPANASATKFDTAPSGPWRGHIFVALFGDEKPMTAPPGPRAGRGLARIDPADWSLHHLADGPFHRPIDVRFHPRSGALHVLDFGEFEMTGEKSVAARAGSGRLWKLPAVTHN